MPWICGLFGSVTGMITPLANQYADRAKRNNQEDVENAIKTTLMENLNPELQGIVISVISAYVAKMRKASQGQL